MPRRDPRFLTRTAASVLGAKLVGPFHRHGPGGWVILDEPELHWLQVNGIHLESDPVWQLR